MGFFKKIFKSRHRVDVLPDRPATAAHVSQREPDPRETGDHDSDGKSERHGSEASGGGGTTHAGGGLNTVEQLRTKRKSEKAFQESASLRSGDSM